MKFIVMKQVVIFASGNGTNAENILQFFRNNNDIEIVAVFTNNKKAGVINRAKKFSVPVFIFSRDMLYKNKNVLDKLLLLKTDLIVLAGFLWKIPNYIIEVFRNRIINIHPALLPEFGGKGMYGDYVHEAVIAAGEKESGITIHYVNEFYDKGDIIIRYKYILSENETPKSLAENIHKLEYAHYPEIIENIIKKI